MNQKNIGWLFMLASFLLVLNTFPSFAANTKLDDCLKSVTAQKGLGRLGVAVLDLDSGAKFALHGEDKFPLQSVFKFPLAVAVLQLVDQKKLSLEDKIALKKRDMTVLYSPLADAFKGPEHSYSISELIESAVQLSDNTACDVLLDKIGGTSKVSASIKSAGINGLRVDRYERQLQADILALPRLEPPGSTSKAKWQSEVAAATGVEAKKAFDFYLYKDERDTSTPDAMVAYLQKFHQGKLLSPASTKYLFDVMTGTKTGGARIKAGLTPGSSLAHKTGTGPSLKGVYSGTNDIGIITTAKGRHLAIAVFLSASTLSEAKQERTICDVARCITANF